MFRQFIRWSTSATHTSATSSPYSGSTRIWSPDGCNTYKILKYPTLSCLKLKIFLSRPTCIHRLLLPQRPWSIQSWPFVGSPSTGDMSFPWPHSVFWSGKRAAAKCRRVLLLAQTSQREQPPCTLYLFCWRPHESRNSKQWGFNVIADQLYNGYLFIYNGYLFQYVKKFAFFTCLSVFFISVCFYNNLLCLQLTIPLSIYIFLYIPMATMYYII